MRMSHSGVLRVLSLDRLNYDEFVDETSDGHSRVYSFEQMLSLTPKHLITEEELQRQLDHLGMPRVC